MLLSQQQNTCCPQYQANPEENLALLLVVWPYLGLVGLHSWGYISSLCCSDSDWILETSLLNSKVGTWDKACCSCSINGVSKAMLTFLAMCHWTSQCTTPLTGLRGWSGGFFLIGSSRAYWAFTNFHAHEPYHCTNLSAICQVPYKANSPRGSHRYATVRSYGMCSWKLPFNMQNTIENVSCQSSSTLWQDCLLVYYLAFLHLADHSWLYWDHQSHTG